MNRKFKYNNLYGNTNNLKLPIQLGKEERSWISYVT